MKFKTEQEFLAALYRYFGINEALRSDQSYEALRGQIDAALMAWAGRPANNIGVRWTFSDRVIATGWIEQPAGTEWKAWEIPYTMGEGGDIVFGTPVEVNQVQLFEPVSESQQPHPNKQRLIEVAESALSVIGEGEGGGKRIKAIGVTAGIVNGNRRRYPRAVLADAVQRLNSKLNESAGQGRLLLTGEAEHPSDKGGKANILETVFRWDAVSLNAAGQVVLEGAIIPTSKGRDLQAIAESGVPIKLSQRGYGEMTTIKESGQTINEVTYLEITGYDAVANPSDPTAGLTESQQSQEKKKTMNLEELLKQLAESPDKLAEFLRANPALTESVVGQMGFADKRQLAGQLGVSPGRLEQSLKELSEKAAQLEERQKAEAIDKAVTEACKDLPYGKLNERFVESIREAKPQTAEDVLKLVEAKTKEYDAIVAAMRLAGMGHNGDIQVLGPVFERETGQPEFTRPAWEVNESMVRAGTGKRRDMRKILSGNGEPSRAELFTAKVLKRFDENYRQQLLAESKLFTEAETTTDLNLPYTVSRAIIEQAFPELVAANIFDFGVATASPEKLFFETYAGESGSSATVTDEVVTGDHGVWVALAYKRLRPGTVVLTNSGGGTTYVEGTDYVIDYANGKIMTLAAGSTTDSQSLKIDYTYDAIRKGENTEIERAKISLSSMTMEIAADRLAVQITKEAVVFSRSQLGYDAVGRTLNNLVREIRRIIDKGILYRALAASLLQANNSGGTWASASDPIAQLVEKMGVAKTKVYNRFYVPTAFVMSTTTAERLSNWDGFTRLGFDNATLNAAGFAGSVKGLPIFATPEFSDSYILTLNRELIMHRVFQAMAIYGPFPSFSNGKLVAADQYYTEEFNGTECPVVEKAAYMVIS